jgi:hypothetical protein
MWRLLCIDDDSETRFYTQNMTGSISDDVIPCLNLHNHSSGTLALGLPQTLREVSTRNLPKS